MDQLGKRGYSNGAARRRSGHVIDQFFDGEVAFTLRLTVASVCRKVGNGNAFEASFQFRAYKMLLNNSA